MNNDNIDKNILNIDNIDKKIIENTIEKLQANREYYKLKYLERKSNGYYEEYKKKKELLEPKQKELKPKKESKPISEEKALNYLLYQRNYQREYQRNYIQSKLDKTRIKIPDEDIVHNGKKGRPKIYKSLNVV